MPFILMCDWSLKRLTSLVLNQFFLWDCWAVLQRVFSSLYTHWDAHALYGCLNQLGWEAGPSICPGWSSLRCSVRAGALEWLQALHLSLCVPAQPGVSEMLLFATKQGLLLTQPSADATGNGMRSNIFCWRGQWWPVAVLLPCLEERGGCFAGSLELMRGGAVGLHGIETLGSIPLAENRGVPGERFVCRWGSCIQLRVGPCVGQLGHQGLPCCCCTHEDIGDKDTIMFFRVETFALTLTPSFSCISLSASFWVFILWGYNMPCIKGLVLFMPFLIFQAGHSPAVKYKFDVFPCWSQ